MMCERRGLMRNLSVYGDFTTATVRQVSCRAEQMFIKPLLPTEVSHYAHFPGYSDIFFDGRLQRPH